MKPFLKVINLHHHQPELINKARKGDREAQNEIFKRFSPTMLGLCRSYVGDLHYSEDVMVMGFFKVFKNLGSFKGEGSFEGWIRRIMVRQCIDHLRRKSPEQFHDPEWLRAAEMSSGSDLPESLEVEALQSLIDEMPGGYRTVFLLYAVEGFSHKEIAAQLEISESTSKSQLFKARKLLQQKLAGMKESVYEVRRI